MPKRTTFNRAQYLAGRAYLRGDIAAAARWFRIMQDMVSAARGPGDLENHRPMPRPKPPKPAPPAPSGPVMLDPKGFSPSGQPNWYLNQQRLERAGLKSFPDRPGTSQTGQRKLIHRR